MRDGGYQEKWRRLEGLRTAKRTAGGSAGEMVREALKGKEEEI